MRFSFFINPIPFSFYSSKISISTFDGGGFFFFALFAIIIIVSI
jgi:hypothetical protein